MNRLSAAMMFLLMTALAPAALAQAGPSSSGIQSGGESATDEDIRQLFAVMGLNKLGEQMWEQINERLTNLNPQIPDSLWQEIDKEFRVEFSSGRFGEMLLPIYKKYFSSNEIKQLITFYESPLGKKFIDVGPQLMGDAMAAGSERGREIVKRIQDKLKKKGYTLQAD